MMLCLVASPLGQLPGRTGRILGVSKVLGLLAIRPERGKGVLDQKTAYKSVGISRFRIGLLLQVAHQLKTDLQRCKHMSHCQVCSGMVRCIISQIRSSGRAHLAGRAACRA